MFVWYNYADKFLYLYMETHVSQTFVNCSKNSSIMEELLTSFGAQYGVNFLGETKLDFWPTDYSFFVFEESARQTSVSAV